MSSGKKAKASYDRKRYQYLRLNKPWYTLLRKARYRAKEKQLPFDLDDDWAKEQWTGVCALTNLQFDLTTGKRIANFLSPSIDRITPSEGYTKDNCRFICVCVNAFKGSYTDEQMIHVAKALIKTHG